VLLCLMGKKHEIRSQLYYLSCLPGYFSYLETHHENRNKGRSCNEIKEGYFKYITEKHILFYRQFSKTEIQIVRILYGSIDVDFHL